MREIELGSSPADEPCAQLGADDYHEANLKETRRYIKLLQEMFPERPPSCRFVRQANQHDFGTYYEVAVTYDEDDPKAVEFAFHVESNLPAKWPAEWANEMTRLD